MIIKIGDLFYMLVGVVEVIKVGDLNSTVRWRNMDGKWVIAHVSNTKLTEARRMKKDVAHSDESNEAGI